ncbi:MAG: phage major capsid protein, partial [Deltaproteobacteria bacterium]|nr:phage major capsid protein [Deltaproteobacteria bacterium]
TRDLEKKTATKGPELIATDLLSQNFIDLLRNKMVLADRGAITLTGLVGDIAIPKLTGGATAYWVAEGTAPTESELTLGQVAFSPKDVAAFSDIS